MQIHVRVVPPVADHWATMIWLVGLGQDEQTFLPLATELTQTHPNLKHVFVVPSLTYITLNGTHTTAWLRQSIQHLNRADKKEIAAATQAVHDLINQEVQLVGRNRIILAGFSQGAAVALVAMMSYPQALGGVVLFAPYAIRDANLKSLAKSQHATTPIWLGHGYKDLVITVRQGAWLREALKKWGYAVEWHSYRCMHEIPAQAHQDINQYVSERLASQTLAISASDPSLV